MEIVEEYMSKCLDAFEEYIRDNNLPCGRRMNDIYHSMPIKALNYEFADVELYFDNERYVIDIVMSFCGINPDYLSDDFIPLLYSLSRSSGLGLFEYGKQLTFSQQIVFMSHFIVSSKYFNPEELMTHINQMAEYINENAQKEIDDYVDHQKNKQKQEQKNARNTIIKLYSEALSCNTRGFFSASNPIFWLAVGLGCDINDERIAWYEHIPFLVNGKVNSDFILCMEMGADVGLKHYGSNILDLQVAGIDFFDNQIKDRQESCDETKKYIKELSENGKDTSGVEARLKESEDSLRKSIKRYEEAIDSAEKWIPLFFDFILSDGCNLSYGYINYEYGSYHNPLSKDERKELLIRLCNNKPAGERPLDIIDRANGWEVYNLLADYTFDPENPGSTYSHISYRTRALRFATDADEEAYYEEKRRKMEEYDSRDYEYHKKTIYDYGTPEEIEEYELRNGGAFTEDELADYYGYDSVKDYYDSL